MQESISLYHFQVEMNICSNYFFSIKPYQVIFVISLHFAMKSYLYFCFFPFFYNSKFVPQVTQSTLAWIYLNHYSLIFCKASPSFHRTYSWAIHHLYQLFIFILGPIYWTNLWLISLFKVCNICIWILEMVEAYFSITTSTEDYVYYHCKLFCIFNQSVFIFDNFKVLSLAGYRLIVFYEQSIHHFYSIW